MRRKKQKLEGRRRKIEWRIWKREVVAFLQSHTLLKLEFDNVSLFFFFE